jgi:DNA repair protein RadC
MEDLPMQLPLFPPPTICDPPERPALTYLPIFRVELAHDGAMTAPRPQLRSSADAADLLRRYLGPVDREHFVIILLNRKNRMTGIHTVSVGSLTASVVHPREVFKVAILGNAASVVLGHNHPSGDPQPSQEDRTLTARLVEAGKLLGISVLDHVIIGDGTTEHFSFADNHLL